MTTRELWLGAAALLAPPGGEAEAAERRREQRQGRRDRRRRDGCLGESERAAVGSAAAGQRQHIVPCREVEAEESGTEEHEGTTDDNVVGDGRCVDRGRGVQTDIHRKV